MKKGTFIIERTYAAPIDAVWNAITDTKAMKVWYFDLKEFKTEVGFEFEFTGGTPERQYLHLCKVTEVVPGKKITYSWRYDGYEGLSFVTFELSAEGSGTKLTLTHTGLDSFPSSNLDFVETNFVAGWTELIEISLKNYLEKKAG